MNTNATRTPMTLGALKEKMADENSGWAYVEPHVLICQVNAHEESLSDMGIKNNGIWLGMVLDLRQASSVGEVEDQPDHSYVLLKGGEMLTVNVPYSEMEALFVALLVGQKQIENES